MKIERFVLGPLQTNCYLVYDEACLEGVVIDPADEGDFLSQKILDLALDLKFIIATHGHFDHVCAALELKLNFNSPFLMHKADLPLLFRVQETARYFTGLKVDPPAPVDKFLKEGDLIAFGQHSLKVIETPGHTLGSISLFGLQILKPASSDTSQGGQVQDDKEGVQDDKGRTAPILFSGDTLFCQGVGRTDFSYSSQEDLIKSLKKKIFVLPDETRVYPGHGEETTIGEEKEQIL